MSKLIFSTVAKVTAIFSLFLLVGSLSHAADFALQKNNADWATGTNWTPTGPLTNADDGWVFTGPDGTQYFNGVYLGGSRYVRGGSGGSTFAGKTLHLIAPTTATAPIDAGMYVAYAKTYTVNDMRLSFCSIKQNNATIPGGVLNGNITLSRGALIGSNGNARSLTVNATISGDASEGPGLQIGQSAIDPTTTTVTFTAANTFTGKISQIGSTFRLGNNNALGNITTLKLDGTTTSPAILTLQTTTTVITMPDMDLIVGNGKVVMNGTTMRVKSLTVGTKVTTTPCTINVADLITSYPSNFAGTGNILVQPTVNPVKRWSTFN